MFAFAQKPVDKTHLLADYAGKIEQADIYDVAIKTPLQAAPTLSELVGQNVFLKREDTQSVFSFKIRGAANKMQRLTKAERAAGVITASAGNHAQGVALAAKKLNIKATIVMPRTTPGIKVNAVRRNGATVVLFGDAFPEALQHALDLQAEHGMTFVHPYDDADVIAGQGTIGKEILEQQAGPIEAVFVPVGGGGLIAGVVAWIKHTRPSVKIIGVEPMGSDCLHQALTAGSRVKLPQVGLFADGVAVAQIGEKPFELLRDLLDATILVSIEEISAAAWDIFSDTRTMPEPAGALGVAGLKKYAESTQALGDGALIAIVSGANVDPDRVRYMAERISIGQKREILMSATLPEHPRTLLEFCHALNGHGITEFNYRYANKSEAQIFVGVRVANYAKDAPEILANLRAKGFVINDLTDNDMVKEHLRHMVGGRPPYALGEVLYSFEFPERPGALQSFLEKMPEHWNISLFHYRSQGASHGRVLMGFQVPENERDRLKILVEGGEFNGKDETDNPAYALFLGDHSET
jgi:threonine dehydratase